MKHILFILIAFFCLQVPYLFCQPLPKNEYSHKFYSQLLTDHIYPMIKNHLKEYERPIDKEEAEKIIEDVKKKIIIGFTKKNIPVVKPPDLRILKITTNSHYVFLLEVNIILYDIDESPPGVKLILKYTKGFVIFLYNKNTMFTELVI